ncbi:Retron-type reverse transcriptase-like protein [Nitrosococcus halophilus Nc 4]|uniref:Retron-type reverse transcriptase-like protein n=1 Tax=Nitrosococcus halophilus (strain Nc4) TaxID=472759 RepID=D5C3P0_NITHN|nr:Retron-type reverse transcriptase-like protein [Nitrosococcus halophilus]ADE15012.1 Retron-type reverse transcriptase-like protein [Nitrosococcus halophilus Nc 4]
MGDMKGRRVRKRTSNWEAEVKLWGPGAKADSPVASQGTESPMFGVDLMEAICERDNLRRALKRVRANRGSPGTDGMGVEELADYLRVHWPSIKEQLLAGDYPPQPVKRVAIPKPGKRGEIRQLGIPCVMDRFIQQAILQVLQPRWDASFSEQSYGFGGVQITV